MKDDENSMLLEWQGEQHRHDQRNHADIACLHKTERLKHYGLHYAKYVGRLAREGAETIPAERTVVDTALVCLSAANTLQQRLEFPSDSNLHQSLASSEIGQFADATGRFADACEKIDHLEEFVGLAKKSNQDILNWVLSVSSGSGVNLSNEMKKRRRELAERQFYILD